MTGRIAGVLVTLATGLACAQTPPMPTELVAAGAGYNRASSPQLAGWASYVHRIAQDIYSYSTYEVTAAKGTPFRAITSTRTGFALFLRAIGPITVFALGDAGVALAGNASGTNVGGAFSGGGIAAISLGKGFWVLGAIRQVKSSLSDAQPIFELGLGWGKP